MAYVAAFRAYDWNDDIATLARRFFAACPAGRQVVLADETRGKLPIEGYEVVSHTEDTAWLDLPNRPAGKSLWYNVDYGLYILRARLPGFDHYLLSESDLAVNLDLEPVLAAAAARGLDLIAHQVRQPGPDWFWYGTGKPAFDDLWAALLFFMVVSGRAADLLLQTRQRQAAAFAAGGLAHWPFCEAFVPSVLKQAGMEVAGVGEFADTRHLNFRPRIALADPRASRPGTLVHSVLGGDDFIKGVIGDYDPADWFKSGSQLREALATAPFGQVWRPLLERFERAGDHAGISAFRREIAARGEKPPPLPDLAYCKPSMVSSVSQWSRSPQERLEAGGANGVTEHEDYGFHTLLESNPWWAVDLLDSYVIDEISILNRLTMAERFRTFAVQSSLDGSGWVTRFLKMDLSEVSADPANPHRIRFSDPFLARHVRIVLLGTAILHLRRVRIFGRALAAG